MKVLTSALLLPSLLPAAFAQSYFTSVICTTKVGKSSVANVGTTTKTIAVISTATLQTTTTVSSTVTPPPVSTVVTETAWDTATISVPTVTDTFISSSTLYITSTVNTTTTTTVTTEVDSTVTVTPTSIVPTSSGFLPVASASARQKRAVGPPMRFDKRAKAAHTSAAVYPQTISCTEVEMGTTTLTKWKFAKTVPTVTAAPSTISSLTTTTLTTTTTVVPADAEVTTIYVYETFETQTLTQTSTVVSTLSGVVTVSAPTATVYAACSAPNLVNTLNGSPIGGLQISGTVQPADWSNTGSAYDCCVACFKTPNCAGASWVDGQCAVYPVGGSSGTAGGTCDPNHYFGDFFPYNGDQQTVINGNCGRWASGMGGCYNMNGGSC